ncbi:MAG: hypothetical protein IJX67_05580 [Oscillospiraceae bacterium]|nr:hypothetical protein [Oscillospiraceae bacterium]
MTLTDQVYAQAMLLAGEISGTQTELLSTLSAAAVASLSGRMKSGLTPEDCKADFIAAASLYALAALSEAGDSLGMEQVTLGDVTLKRKNGDAAANCLRNQADLMMFPYLKDRFSFLGV